MFFTVDFRRQGNKLNPINNVGEEVKVVEEYKYLDILLHNKFNRICNSGATYTKAQSKLYFLRKLMSVKDC